MSKGYDDGVSYNDAEGNFDPNRLPESVKAEIKSVTAALASMAGAGVSSGNGLHNAQVGGVIGHNAVENNYLTKEDWNIYKRKLNQCEKQGKNIPSCYELAKKDLYRTSANRNAILREACSPKGDLELCKQLVKEADESRILTQQELNSLGYIRDKTPIIPTTIAEVEQSFRIPNPSFIDYYDIPWANNPTIHYWAANISLPIFNRMDYGMSIAVNRVTGEIFLGVNAAPHLKDGNNKKFIDVPSANAVIGHINQMSSLEKARLWETITNTILGEANTASTCAYFGCIGVSQTLDRKKVAFEMGLGTSKVPTVSFGKANMFRIGKIIFKGAKQAEQSNINVQQFAPTNPPSIGDMLNVIPSYQ